MRWLRYGTVVLCVVTGTALIALILHVFWIGSQDEPSLLAQKVRDFQLLVVILLTVTWFYTVIFLLAPGMSDRILKQHAEETITAVRDQLAAHAGELRELKEEIRHIVPGQRPGALNTEMVQNGGQYLHLIGRLRILNNATVETYRALATLCIPHDLPAAKTYLGYALALSPDPEAAAEIHYDRACLLARQGEMAEAAAEVETALRNKSPELWHKLARDTEEGGPLYELAAKQPYGRVLDELLMHVSVGA